MNATRSSAQKTQAVWMARTGAALLLLGMLSGLVTGAMTNPRMGLSAHLEGLMNGTLLIALSAIWDRLALGARSRLVAFVCFCTGSVVNWLSTQLAALWGTGALTPIIGAGISGSYAREIVVSVGLILSTLTMLLAALLLLVATLRFRDDGRCR